MELCRELINDRNSGRKRPPTRRSSLPRSMAPPPHPLHPHHPLQHLHHLLVATSTPRLVVPILVFTTPLSHQTERYASDTFLILDCFYGSVSQVPPYSPLPPTYHHLPHLPLPPHEAGKLLPHLPPHEAGALLRLHHIPFPGGLAAFCK